MTPTSFTLMIASDPRRFTCSKKLLLPLSSWLRNLGVGSRLSNQNCFFLNILPLRLTCCRKLALSFLLLSLVGGSKLSNQTWGGASILPIRLPENDNYSVSNINFLLNSMYPNICLSPLPSAFNQYQRKNFLTRTIHLLFIKAKCFVDYLPMCFVLLFQPRKTFRKIVFAS